MTLPDRFTPWQERAACRGLYRIFLSESATAIAYAKSVCASCDVFTQCAESSIGEPEGTRAGLAAAERVPFGAARVRWLRCSVCDVRFQGLRGLFCGDDCRRAARARGKAAKRRAGAA